MSVPKLRVDASGIHGLWAILPTPAIPQASDWRIENTVDLDESARMVNALIEAGVDGLLSLGTYGEGSTLQWDEKVAFMDTAVQTIGGRIPYFCGTTALNTREVIRQTREAHALGVSGTMLGLPMWCRPDLATAVNFFRDVTEACPDTAICVYANPDAFKFDFGTPFWAQVSRLPQIVTAKYRGIGALAADLDVAPSIRLLPHEADYYAAAQISDRITAFWSSSALCGPLPALRLRDTVRAARETGDWSKAKAITSLMRQADAGMIPNGDFAEFSKYNIGIEKERMNAAGWMQAGPCRPPYHLVPEAYLEASRRSGRAYAKLNGEFKTERTHAGAAN
jgi:trans-o-hydroxybenzylidenepyruvate hydratase-aldolase